MIKFIEDDDSGYKHRTEVNAQNADITIAFCIDFTTSGEIMTKGFALKHHKIYYPFPLKCSNIQEHIDNVVRLIHDNNCHSINIAGNGAYTLTKNKISQKECDDYILNVLSEIVKQSEIKEIRSGGQTGADESGLKSALALNIDAVCVFPKGWKIRTANETIMDEKYFKSRFLKRFNKCKTITNNF